MNKLRLGIIGYGNMGTAHVQNLCAGKVPNIELTAMCDCSEARRKAFAGNYPDIPVFEEPEEMYRSGLCDQMVFYRNVISEREFNRTNEQPFGCPETWKCEIPVSFSGGEQHVGILKNYASAVLHGTDLLAKGEEGINGLTISNAIHLSAWTGESIEIKDFPDDRFYKLLQEKINTSTVQKVEKQVVADTSNTY